MSKYLQLCMPNIMSLGICLKKMHLIKVGVFEYFCQIPSKIDSYNFELYRFKVRAFFETQCR